VGSIRRSPLRRASSSARTLTALAFSLLLAFTAACAPAPPRAARPRPAPERREVTDTAQLLAIARKKGLALENPLALERPLIQEAAQAVGTYGAPEQRLHRLIAFLNDGTRFQYTPNLSLTASQAYKARRGDCMAYSNMFIALSRALGLPTYFVHVSEVLSHYEHEGLFFTSSHVAVGYGTGPSALVVDFTKETTDWKLSIYRSIDDATAAALYYNNLAVDAMMAGRLDEAEGLFRFLTEQKPEIEEIYNNLGVLLNRRARYKEALAVLQKGMRVFPSYKPFYTNGLVAARGAKRADLEKDFEERGQEISDRSPYFVFARGMRLFQGGEFARAAEELERAASLLPQSPVIYAWLARAYLSAGRVEEGRQAFAEARKLAPESRALKDLEAQFPELH
jgi:tetratricopeptide (TPR) repeat protein